MKKLLLLVLNIFIVGNIIAQSPVNFGVVISSKGNLSEEAKDALKLKVEQILGRQNAGATSVYNAFVIEPFITITEQKSTQGSMRNVTLTQAELTLVAKNLYDGSLYNTSVVEISSNTNGVGDAAIKNLIRNININDAAYTRFIRLTRERILAHYEANCETIMLKAQTMLNMEQVEDAIGYLSSVPEVVGCYGNATALLEQAFEKSKSLGCDKNLLMARSRYIMKDYATALDLLARIPSDSECSDAASALTDSIELKIGGKSVLSFESFDPSDDLPAFDDVVIPNTSLNGYQQNVSCPELEFQLISCIGYESSQTIIIEFKVTNGGANGKYYVYSKGVVDENGQSYNKSGDDFMNLPTGIAVTNTMQINPVVKKINKLAYVELIIDRSTVTLKEIPVIWK